jgi:hypothetical protein
MEYQRVMVSGGLAGQPGAAGNRDRRAPDRPFPERFRVYSTALADSVYWSDLALAQPPLRLARMPASATPTQRFIKPAAAYRDMLALLDGLERGGDVPADIDLGGQYPAKLVARVLKHLASYLAPIPPQRQHERHRVMHRMSVLPGLVNSFVVFPANSGPAGRLADRELGGRERQPRRFRRGARQRAGRMVESRRPDRHAARRGDNWLVGVIRRYHRVSEHEARVGIEALARQADAQEVRVRSASSYGAAAATPVLLLRDGNAPASCASSCPTVRFRSASRWNMPPGGRYLLEPLALVEQTTDYELARYRQTVLGAA